MLPKNKNSIHMVKIGIKSEKWVVVVEEDIILTIKISNISICIMPITYSKNSLEEETHLKISLMMMMISSIMVSGVKCITAIMTLSHKVCLLISVTMEDRRNKVKNRKKGILLQILI